MESKFDEFGRAIKETIAEDIQGKVNMNKADQNKNLNEKSTKKFKRRNDTDTTISKITS